MPRASPAARRDCGGPSPKSPAHRRWAQQGAVAAEGTGGGQITPARATQPWELGAGGAGHSRSPLRCRSSSGELVAGPHPMKQPPRCRLCWAQVLRCCGTHRTCAQVTVPLCPSPRAAHLPAPARRLRGCTISSLAHPAAPCPRALFTFFFPMSATKSSPSSPALPAAFRPAQPDLAALPASLN